VSNIIKILLILFLTISCSNTKNLKFWSNNQKVEEIKIENKNLKQKNIQTNKDELVCKSTLFIKYDCKYEIPVDEKVLYAKEEPIREEFNPSLKINLSTKPTKKSTYNYFSNNNGKIDYNGNLKSISKYRYSKIDNFYQFDPEISFDKDNIIFFDNKGTVLKFNKDSKLLWKKNYYSKSQKKQNPILLFANNENILIVADNIAKYYALNIQTGEMLWSKNNTAPFNSQLKIYKDKFFVIDFENTLRCYSIKDGTEIWKIKTENSLIRSQKKLSLVIIDERVYFNNSLGDISAVDIKSGNLLWQKPTQSTLVYDQGFFLKTSDLIADKNSLYFSNNMNQFFSIDINTGSTNWIQKINSNLRPTLIGNYLFTISLEGFLIIIEKDTGNIVRISKLFKNVTKKYLLEDKGLRDEIIPIGFIIGNKYIYLTTNKGRLYIIDIKTGQTDKVLRVDKGIISRPLVSSQNLYIIKDNSIIKLN
jgi:outer membrane protein assembly factor BamB